MGQVLVFLRHLLVLQTLEFQSEGGKMHRKGSVSLRTPSARSRRLENPSSWFEVGSGDSLAGRGCSIPPASLSHPQDGAGVGGHSLLGVFCGFSVTTPGPGRDGAMSQPWQV